MRFTTALALFATSSYALDVAEHASGKPTLFLFTCASCPPALKPTHQSFFLGAALMARACPSGKKSCGKACIPSAASCCGGDSLLSQYCNEGAVCNNQSENPTVWWCCPKSKPKCSIIDPNTAFPEFGVPGLDGDSGSGSGSGSGSSGSGSSGSGSSGSGSGSGSNSDDDKSGSSGSNSNSGSGSSNSNGNGNSNNNGNSNGNSNSQGQSRPKNAAARDGASVAAVVLAAAAIMAL